MSESERIALVTGGARGIGRGIVQYLAHQGWRVVFCDTARDVGEELASGCDGRAKFVAADVARESDVKRLIQSALKWGGRLDAVINNAGIANPETGPIEELSLKDWQRRLDVNLTGPFLVTKHAVAALRESRGAIVNLASTRALQSEPDTEAYASTKGGVVALTHALAVSLGPDIRVNCVSPGWIDTRAHQGGPEGVPPLTQTDHSQHPAGRVGMPDDIATLVEYLISPKAGFITGQNIVADGGMTRKMIYED